MFEARRPLDVHFMRAELTETRGRSAGGLSVSQRLIFFVASWFSTPDTPYPLIIQVPDQLTFVISYPKLATSMLAA
jgi:hypothetical protein